MMNNLTKEIAYTELSNFFKETPFVLLGTGTSCAVDVRYGMEALKNELVSKMGTNELDLTQAKEWKNTLESINNGVDFEKSMNTIKDNNLISMILKITGDYISNIDKIYSLSILTGNKTWPAINLLKKLVNGTSDKDNSLHVATTNYDMLAEYAFEKEEIPYINGFIGGVNRTLNWEQSIRSITYIDKIRSNRKIKNTVKKKKHIRLYKVHGSLNTFLISNHIVENNNWINSHPSKVKRLMIAPGAAKHERLHEFRETLLSQFDNAIKNYTRFLFLGFGFNDTQLVNNTLKKKLTDQKCKGLIITKEANDRIFKILKESDSLWLICNYKNGKSQVINKNYSDPLYLDNNNIWELNNFSEEILGG